MANEVRSLEADEERLIREAEGRLGARLEQVTQAHAERRLSDLVRDTPSVEEQLRPFLDASS